MNLSFVYAFQLDNGIKIGKSDNPETRKSHFQTTNLQKINTICILETPESYHYEEITHKLLKQYRTTQREIFCCSSELVILTFEYIKKIQEGINKTKNNIICNNNLRPNIDNEKFIKHYNITKQHMDVFYKLKQSIYDNTISSVEFEKFIKKKKLIYTIKLFEIFNKFLLFVDNHSINDIDSNAYEFIFTFLEYSSENKIHCNSIWKLYKSWYKKELYIKDRVTQCQLEKIIEHFFELEPKTKIYIGNIKNNGWQNINLKNNIV